MRLHDTDAPESKVLKGGWASRDEQREKRGAYRHAVKQAAPVAHSKKKNTRKWCKGKVGAAHDYQPIPIVEKWTFLKDRCPADEIKHAAIGGYKIWFERCTACGRTEYHSGKS